MKASDYYFSTPFPRDDLIVVAIIPKKAYDKDRTHQDGGPEYEALFDFLPDEWTESSETVFEPMEEMDRDAIMTLLKSRGFIYNPKLDSDIANDNTDLKEYFNGLGIKTEKIAPRSRVYMTIGLPASGKSTRVKSFAGMRPKIVSRDLCGGSKAKARSELEEMLSEGGFIIIDDTNYNREVRAEIITLVKQYNPLNITGIYMNVDKQTCLERNKTRDKKVPAIAIHTIAKKFEPPTLEEGFTDIMVFDKNGKSRIIS